MMNRFIYILFILTITASVVTGSDIDQPQEQGFYNFNTPNKVNSKPATQATASPSKIKSSNPNTGIFPLTKAEIPRHIHNKGYGVLDGVIYPKGQQYSGKLPIDKNSIFDPRTGIFLTQPPIGYVLYRATANAPLFDRLLLDSNLNDTLGDEIPIIIDDITKKTPVKLNFGGDPISFDLQLGSKGLRLYPKYWQKGKINLKNKTYNAAIFKSTYGGEYGYGVVLLIDFNNDGEYTTSDFEYLTEAFLLQKQMVIKGRFYDAEIDKKGTKLTLKNMDSDFGQIFFIMPKTAEGQTGSYKFSFLPQGGSGRDILKVALEELPVTLPVGRYGIIEGLVYSKDYRILLKFACPEFNILKDKRLKLSLASARMETIARQEDNKLVVAQKTFGPRNIYFNLVGPADPNDPGPELLVYEAKNPTNIIFDDNLEYG